MLKQDVTRVGICRQRGSPLTSFISVLFTLMLPANYYFGELCLQQVTQPSGLQWVGKLCHGPWYLCVCKNTIETHLSLHSHSKEKEAETGAENSLIGVNLRTMASHGCKVAGQLWKFPQRHHCCCVFLRFSKYLSKIRAIECHGTELPLNLWLDGV